MRVINKIAKVELSQFFYSPIAWLVLIVFTAQASIAFVDIYQYELMDAEAGRGVQPLTNTIFASWRGIFSEIQEYLYLYIPLLTMGLISKEKANGSIKLLFSSPISNTQIILGKFQAMLVNGLLLMGILFIIALFCHFTIEQFDMAHVLSGLLGIYLLTCAYAAIGLFMSTLTSYQVVAVVSTLAVLTILNMVADLAKDIAFLREIAYWLSLKGRSNEMLKGLICSEDVIYFLLIIVLFLTLSIFKLNHEQKRLKNSTCFIRYAAIVTVAFTLGQISTIPYLKTFYDATRTKTETLTPSSQEIVKQLDGPLTITAYVNLLDPYYERYLPKNRNRDKKVFEKFTRFKPEIKFKYVYYWDKAYNPNLYAVNEGMTDEEIVNSMIKKLKLDPDLFKSAKDMVIPEEIKQENNRFTRILERGNGEKTVLRIFESAGYEPEEGEIAAALKRLTEGGACQMAFLTGHGEPSIHRIGERGLSNFTIASLSKKALINNGFDMFEINLKEQELDPAQVDMIVITQMKEAFTEAEMVQLKNYLAKGGNMLVAGEPGCQDFMNPLLEEFGIQFMPGRVMQNNPNFVSNLALAQPTKEAEKLDWHFRWMNRWKYKTPMLNATAIDYTKASSKGVETMVIMETDSMGFWNELTHIGYNDTEAALNPEIGETEEALALAVRANRKVGEKEQRIFVISDTDWLTNVERSTRRNKLNSEYEHLLIYAMSWLTYDSYPVNVDRPTPPDRKFHIKTDSLPWIKGIFWFGLPLILSIFCIAIQVKRKRK